MGDAECKLGHAEIGGSTQVPKGIVEASKCCLDAQNVFLDYQVCPKSTKYNCGADRAILSIVGSFRAQLGSWAETRASLRVGTSKLMLQ